MVELSGRPDEYVMTRLTLVVLALAGLLLIVVSLNIPDHGSAGYYRELLKELGIVLLAVFTVSLLYEVILAEKYIAKFMTQLREEVQRGESNAAACAKLGILEIFPSRATFERRHPLDDLLSGLAVGGRLLVVGRSLILLMGKLGPLKRAIAEGATLRLCLYDPNAASAEVDICPDLELSDVQSAIAVFRKQIVGWLEQSKPQGAVELRCHRIAMLDSYTAIDSSSIKWGIWDWSFGRDVEDKRIVVINLQQTLGSDLSARYEHVWGHGRVLFRYENHEVIENHIATAPGGVA